MIKIYRNKKWLEEKYLKEKLSTYQIAKLCKTSDEPIRRWLHKHNISIRSNAEAQHLRRGNHCNLSIEATHWLDGELLGDGCLHSYSNYSAYFAYTSKYREYIQYVSNVLRSFGIKQSGKIRIEKKRKCYCYHYSSLSYAELFSIYYKWYPNKKKIIPRDIILTPLICRQWYIGDGSLGYEKNGKPHISLYSNGFTISDVEWLVKQLTELGFKTKRQPSINSINISVHSTKEFLNYIGECPANCYNYKFEY